MQRGEDSRLRAEVLRVGQQGAEGIAHGLKAQGAHHRHGGQPQRMQSMRQREERMRMVTSEQACLLKGEPALGLEIRALGAGAMSTGVRPDTRQVAVGTRLDMPPSAAVRHCMMARAAFRTWAGSGCSTS